MIEHMHDDRQAQATTTANPPPAPRLALTDRYLPRVCAHPGCPLPPNTTWAVTSPGHMFGRHWRKGDTLDLCDAHAEDNGQPVRTPPTPRQRRRR